MRAFLCHWCRGGIGVGGLSRRQDASVEIVEMSRRRDSSIGELSCQRDSSIGELSRRRDSSIGELSRRQDGGVEMGEMSRRQDGGVEMGELSWRQATSKQVGELSWWNAGVDRRNGQIELRPLDIKMRHRYLVLIDYLRLLHFRYRFPRFRFH